MRSERLGEADHGFDASSKASGNPGAEEFASGFPGRHAPEPTEILLQEVCLKERFVERFKSFQVKESVIIESFPAPEEKEPTPFQDVSLGTPQVAIHVAPRCVDGCVCHGDDVIWVVDDFDFRKDISYGKQIGRPHIHSHRLEWRPHSSESTEKGDDRVSASTFFRMKDFTAFQIQDDGHVLVTFADREFVDRDQSDRFQRSCPQPAT